MDKKRNVLLVFGIIVFIDIILLLFVPVALKQSL